MDSNKTVIYLTLVLAFNAGFCDASTFLGAHELFSAHVTGNFIIFAYQVVKGADLRAWLQLMSFPVFILSVMVGGRIAGKSNKKYLVLLVESLWLILIGAILLVLHYSSGVSPTVNYLLSMGVVFAMGLQNAFGKIYAKETIGPTTMMTGNVAQLSLALGQLIQPGISHVSSADDFKKQSITVAGFLVGCLAGTVFTKIAGLGVIIIPGILTVLFFCWKPATTSPR